MNQVQGKDKSCLEYWFDLNSRAAEIELENKTGTEIEQLLLMALFLSGTTNEKLAKQMWNTEYEFKKADEAIKAYNKAEKRRADMRKLKGHKDPKENVKKETIETVNRTSEKIRTERAYHATGVVIHLIRITGKYV